MSKRRPTDPVRPIFPFDEMIAEGGDKAAGHERQDGEEAAQTPQGGEVTPRGQEEAGSSDPGEQGVHCSPNGDQPDDPQEHDPPAARRARGLPDPGKPTPQQIAEHELTHLPFRSWCPDCVRGKAQANPHLRREDRRVDQSIPTISFDYGFASESSKRRQEERKDEEEERRLFGPMMNEEENVDGDRSREDRDVLKVLVVKDERSRTLFSHAVERKGAGEDDYAVRQVVKDVEELGYRQISLKCDQEPSTMALLKRLLRMLNIEIVDQAIHDHPAAGDSQSNGSTENGVKTVMGQLRTMKAALERRLSCELPVNHPIMAWMTTYAGQLLSRFLVGHDGHTPYERLRGKPFRVALPEFGETVWRHFAQKRVPREESGKLRARWEKAIYLGLVPMTNEFYLWTGDAVVRARSVRRLPEANRWDKEGIEAMTQFPWETEGRHRPRVIFEDKEPDAPPDTDHPPTPRQRHLYVRKIDLMKHGFTEGCRRCESMRAGKGNNPGSHSDACRSRIAEAMGEDDPRVRRAIERKAGAERRDAVLEDPYGVEPIPPPAHQEEQVPELPMPPMDENPQDQEDLFPDMISIQDNSDEEDEDMESEHMQATFGEDPTTEEEMKEALDVFLEAERDAKAVEELIQALGGNPDKHWRHTAKKLRAVVSEIYSPPRVTAAAKLMPDSGIIPGFALDLTTTDEKGAPWDFDIPAQRKKAEQKIKDEKPMFLIGSPMCTAFSTWQRINDRRRSEQEKREIMSRARLHLRFTMDLYRLQVAEGRYFIHEHPAYATSWDEDCTRKIMELEGVGVILAHQCQHGMRDPRTGNPIKKPTRYMGNAPMVLQELELTCSGRGGRCSNGRPHETCTGKTAKAAAIYPLQLCRTFIRGMKRQLEHDHHRQPNEVGMTGPWEPLAGIYTMTSDDVTGQELRPELVREARKEEIKFFDDKQVLEKVPKGTSWKMTGHAPIPTRWVDVNKGDDQRPQYRSRLVAKQIRFKGTEPTFAAMPPIEAVRTIASLLATTLPGEDFRKYGPKRMQVSVIDIKRAYFNAVVPESEPQFVELPEEDPDHKRCEGRVMKYMYGLQKAAEGWEKHYTEILEGMEFKRGTASPCVFVHSKRKIYLTVYGDDFSARGRRDDLDWYETQMQEKFDLTVKGRLGYAKEDDHEVRILNRLIRTTDKGVEYEADPRHAEELIRTLELEGCNPTVTPGVKETMDNVKGDTPLKEELMTTFRAAAARCNYLSIDRPDCQFAGKEVCRLMTKPTVRSWAALKRLCRYLVGRPRLIHQFPMQEVGCIDVYTDTDWAGCPRTRRSTSGGMIMLGRHVIKTWSSTQALTSLSSGEAEYYGLVKGAGQGLGYQGLLRDFGIEMPLEMHCDSAAARGIAKRRGLGKQRHIDLQTLWIQEKLAHGAFRLHAIRGTENPADLLTKHLPERGVLSCLRFMGCELAKGRAESAPDLRAGRRREGNSAP